VLCFWLSEDKKGTSSKAVDNKCCLCQTDFFVQQWQEIGTFTFFMSFVSMKKLQEINADQQTNQHQL
jgi:hypothetical protein